MHTGLGVLAVCPPANLLLYCRDALSKPGDETVREVAADTSGHDTNVRGSAQVSSNTSCMVQVLFHVVLVFNVISAIVQN